MTFSIFSLNCEISRLFFRQPKKQVLQKNVFDQNYKETFTSLEHQTSREIHFHSFWPTYFVVQENPTRHEGPFAIVVEVVYVHLEVGDERVTIGDCVV